MTDTVRVPAGNVADDDTAVIPAVITSSTGVRNSIGSSVLAVLLIALTVFGTQVFLARTVAGVGRATYNVSGSDRWLVADANASTGYFRLDPTFESQPVSAVLWVDARDQYQVWVNGNKLLDNRNPARVGKKPVAAGLDIANDLRAGSNVVAIQATSLGEGPAQVWSRLSVQLRTGAPIVLSTDDGQWRSTANTALTGATLGLPPKFINPDFALSGWVSPRRVTVSTQARAKTPLAVLETPMTAAPVTTSRINETDALFATKLALPQGTEDVWIRVASTGGASVLLNGERVGTLPSPGYVSPASHRSATMITLHLGSADRVGAGNLEIHTIGNRSVVVLDALARTGNGWQKIGTDVAGWKVTNLTPPIFTDAGTPTQVTSVWPHGFSREEAAAATHASVVTTATVLIATVALLALLAFGAARLSADRISDWLWRLVVFVALPVGSLTLLLATLSRWTVTVDGFATSKRWNYLLPAVTVVLVLGCLLSPMLSRVGVLRQRSAPVDAGPRSSPAHSRDPEPKRTRTALPSWMPFSARLDAGALGVIAIAVLGMVVMGWRLWRQPLWQDEATTLEVARSIKDHGLPRLSSGLLYFKAEFYHGLLAAVLNVTTDISVLRVISLLWYGGTIAVFGLLLMPVIAPGRRGLQLLATLGMVLVPAEQVWARDVRMYQQMQFFAVLFVALFLRALLTQSRRYTAFSAVALFAMYFSHEESFVLLPAIVAAAVLCWRDSWQLRRAALRWYLPVAVIIGVQYVLSQIHPPDFGADLSNRSYVGWDPNQGDYYYQRVFFAPLGATGSLAVLSTLAVVALVVALRRGERAVALVGVMTVVSALTTSLLFTAKVSRYSFIVMPLLIALAVMGGYYIVAAAAGLTRARVGEAVAGVRVHRLGFGLAAGLLVLACVGTLGVSPRDYGLLAADVTSAPNPYLHPDYQSSVRFLQSRLKPGDEVITLSPPVLTSEYLGRKPDRIIQTGRNKLLYLIYRNGVAVDTILGVPVILNGPDLRSYLEQHKRVWLISDTGGLIQGIPPDLRDEVAQDFAILYQNGGTTVSLRDAG